MKVSEILNDRWRWTQGAMARDRYYDPVHYTYVGAVQYCLSGALLKAYTGAERAAAFRAALAVTGGAIEDWNDDPDRTFEEVLRVAEIADAAAEAAQRKEKENNL
jgi:hypothetical protein